VKLFVSYARANKAAVQAVTSLLQSHEVWMDDRLNIGQDWWQEIERQIAACHCVMFMISPQSLASEYCQKELDFARKLNKAIAPIVLEPDDIPDWLTRLQIIDLQDGPQAGAVVELLNGLFEIERAVFNPLRPQDHGQQEKLRIRDLYFATNNERKMQQFEHIIGVPLQIAHISLEDVQHLDAGEVALNKVQKAYQILKQPVFVEQSALAVRAWGGLPGGMTTEFIVPLGLDNLCKMLNVFDDRYAEALSVIAFTDGKLRRKFVGTLPGTIAPHPRGDGYSWDTIFVPQGFTHTNAEMGEEQYLSISMRRRAIVQFMQFLQSNYVFE